MFHIAKQSLSPWVPVFHSITVAEAPPGNPPAIGGRVYTQVCANLLTGTIVSNGS